MVYNGNELTSLHNTLRDAARLHDILFRLIVGIARVDLIPGQFARHRLHAHDDIRWCVRAERDRIRYAVRVDVHDDFRLSTYVNEIYLESHEWKTHLLRFLKEACARIHVEVCASHRHPTTAVLHLPLVTTEDDGTPCTSAETRLSVPQLFQEALFLRLGALRVEVDGRGREHYRKRAELPARPPLGHVHRRVLEVHVEVWGALT